MTTITLTCIVREPLTKLRQTAFWLFYRLLPFGANSLLLRVCEFAPNGQSRQNNSKVGFTGVLQVALEPLFFLNFLMVFIYCYEHILRGFYVY